MRVEFSVVIHAGDPDHEADEEIAELLGLSRKTIGKRLDRIRDAVTRIAQPAEGAPS